VGNGRLALVVLVATAPVVAAAPGAAGAAQFRYTHQVTISGQMVDNWSISEPGLCGTTGDGSLKLTYQNKAVVKAFVTRERGSRRWLLAGLSGGQFHQVTFLPPKPAVGTSTTIDNTSPTVTSPDDNCTPIDKSGCGTKPLRRPTFELGGQDAKRLHFDLGTADSFPRLGCQVGPLDNFSDPAFFGMGAGQNLLVKMPSARSFFRHRTVTVTGTDHKRTRVQGDPDGPVHIDDITRSVTVTFTKLPRSRQLPGSQ
jgi:hypothetical protein